MKDVIVSVCKDCGVLEVAGKIKDQIKEISTIDVMVNIRSLAFKAPENRLDEIREMEGLSPLI